MNRRTTGGEPVDSAWTVYGCASWEGEWQRMLCSCYVWDILVTGVPSAVERSKLSCRMNKVPLLSVSWGWWILIKNLPDCDWSWINRTFSIKVPVLFYLWLSWVKRPCVFSLYDPKQQNSPATETKGIFQISSAGLENYSVGLETFIYFIADCLIWYVNVILKKGNHTHTCVLTEALLKRIDQ